MSEHLSNRDVAPQVDQADSSNTTGLISIVAPCYCEEAVLPLLGERLRTIGDDLAADYNTEFVLVDDGSHDSTWEKICTFAQIDSRFRGVRLSRNFGHQAALSCGYEMASGDAVISIDADLQDPIEVIPKMIELWCQGHDVVYAVRTRREGETAFKLWTATLFYRLIRALGAKHVQADSGDFRLMSRRSLDELLKLAEQHRFLRGMVGWIGFSTATVEYERQSRAAGVTKYPARKMLQFAVDAIVSFSRAPLRLAYYVAMTLSIVFIGYLGYAVVMFLLFDAELQPGWASLILAVIAFGAANLLCLALMGEYVGRIYEQSKQRPIYIVQEVVAHPVSPSADRDTDDRRNEVENESSQKPQRDDGSS